MTEKRATTRAKKPTIQEIKDLVLFMKDQKVSSFKALGVEVEFSMTAHSTVHTATSLDSKQEDLNDLKQRLKTANEDAEADLLWST